MGDIIAVRQLIENAIGDNKIFDQYLQVLGSYFSGLISQEEMDCALDELLTSEQRTYHEKLFKVFGLTIFKPDQPKPNLSTAYFEHEEMLKSTMSTRDIPEIVPEDPAFSWAFQGFFPDVSITGGYMHTYIWSKREYDLDEITKESIELVTFSIRILIKNILMRIFQSRSQYSQQNEFVYGFGTGRVNDAFEKSSKFNFLNSSMNPTSLSELGEVVPKMQPSHLWSTAQAVNELARRDTKSIYTKRPINIVELHDILLNFPDLLPFCSVYSKILDKCFIALTNLNLAED